MKQQKFWEDFIELAGTTSWMTGRKARPQHWYDVSIGTSQAHLSLTLNHFENWINCELYIPHDEDKVIYDRLYAKKDAIEAELGMSVEWMRLDGKKASRIKATKVGNIANEDAWPEYHAWLIETAESFKKAFAKHIA